MANALFDKGRESFLRGEISWNNDDIKAVLVNHSVDIPNISTDQFLSDIDAGAQVAISNSLTGKTTINGVADADDINFPVVSGPPVQSMVTYQNTGNAATSRLIAYNDTLGTGNFPITPNGGQIILTVDNGPDKLFKL
jgi:hypothetical protein